jgi:hypothetical protein
MSTPRRHELDDTLSARFTELLAREFVQVSDEVAHGQQADAYEWMISAANLIAIATSERGPHHEHANDLLRELRDVNFVQWNVYRNMKGVLAATRADREAGLLLNARYAEVALTFDDFLDHAAEYHKRGKLQESAVLVSSVLEDTMRRIGEKHEIAEQSLEPLINALTEKGVFTPVQAKRVRAYAGVRTSAFHARWDELDLKDVGESIAGVRELVDRYLA